MSMPWLLCGVGVFFCCTGFLLFFKSIYEKEKKILPAILILLMGVLLISLGTARYFHLLD